MYWILSLWNSSTKFFTFKNSMKLWASYRDGYTLLKKLPALFKIFQSVLGCFLFYTNQFNTCGIYCHTPAVIISPTTGLPYRILSLYTCRVEGWAVISNPDIGMLFIIKRKLTFVVLLFQMVGCSVALPSGVVLLHADHQRKHTNGQRLQVHV